MDKEDGSKLRIGLAGLLLIIGFGYIALSMVALLLFLVSKPEMVVHSKQEVQVESVQAITNLDETGFLVLYVEGNEYKTKFVEQEYTTLTIKPGSGNAVFKEKRTKDYFYRMFGVLFRVQENTIEVDKSKIVPAVIEKNKE